MKSILKEILFATLIFLTIVSLLVIGIFAAKSYMLLKALEEIDQIGTPETYYYIEENYVTADPNLVHIETEQEILSGLHLDVYYTILGIPMEQYVVKKEVPFSIWKNDSYHAIMLKKSDVTEEPIFDWTYKSVELFVTNQPAYYLNSFKDSMQSIHRLGKDIYYSHYATIDSQVFKTYLTQSMESGTYGDPSNLDLYDNLLIRVSFVEYENMVWDGALYRHVETDTFYLRIYLAGEDGNYTEKMLPLPAEIVALIPQ